MLKIGRTLKLNSIGERTLRLKALVCLLAVSFLLPKSLMADAPSGFRYRAKATFNSAKHLPGNCLNILKRVVSPSQNTMSLIEHRPRDIKSFWQGDIVYRTNSDGLGVRVSPFRQVRLKKEDLFGRLNNWVGRKAPKWTKSLWGWASQKSTNVKNRYNHASSYDLFNGLQSHEVRLVKKALFDPRNLRNPALMKELRRIEETTAVENLVEKLEELAVESYQFRLAVYFRSAARTSSMHNLRWPLEPDGLEKSNWPQTRRALHYMWRQVKFSSEQLLWLFNPLPHHFRIHGHMGLKVYRQIRINPKTPLENLLSEKQLEWLDDNGLYNDALVYQRSLQSRPGMRQLGHRVAQTFNAAFLTVPLFVAAMTVATLNYVPDEQFVPAQNYIEYALGDEAPVVELILDSSPIPHTALRVRDRVYNPSQATFHVLPIETYFAGFHKGRSVQTVRLNLTPEQVLKMEKYFAERLWKSYANNTGFYDCTTVIADALEMFAGLKVPEVINASPALMMAYLQAEMRLLGNELVQPGAYVVGEGTTTRSLSRAGRILSESVESKLFYLLSPYVVSEQQRIRNEEELFFQGEAYKELRKERLDHYYAKLKETPGLRGLIFYFETMQLIDAQSPEVEETRAKIVVWLTEFKAAEVQEFNDDFNPVLFIEHSAQIDALDKLIGEFRALESP